ncbi:hypothetical protein DFP74_5155 [Nocardiopsis sp. Huas11]|uniref:STM4015 family protein n=1 Tax=Nocardiopsis sp. Huas11 TaxID=2183912 RepID=UPI000EAEC9CC|nr:STM4015 family protein [Nocardiopsis sp. Huas11]RKS09419.1 hypothetical protein DFP74_5155 [Nocardiopsis sp. Huas11]
MVIQHHLTSYAGLPVVEFPSRDLEEERARSSRSEARRTGTPPVPVPPDPALEAALRDPGSVAWRLRSMFCEEEEFAPYVDRFLAAVDTTGIRALLVGGWCDFTEDAAAEPARDLLIAHADRFPALRSLFFGEIVAEEYEISWIQQADLAPLLAAFPELTELTVRGAGDPGPAESDAPDAGLLRLAVPGHTALRRLTVQSGGLPGHVCRQIASSGLPALEHLELWLGVREYRGDAVPADLDPVLSGGAFPNLVHLGLRDAEDTDAWVEALAEAPLTTGLRTLDLSLGTLTDRGARVLLGAPVFRRLQRLDLHHHFVSPDLCERLRGEFTAAGVEIDVREPRGDRDETYPAVTE